MVCAIAALSQKSTACPFFVSLTTRGASGGTVLQLGGSGYDLESQSGGLPGAGVLSGAGRGGLRALGGPGEGNKALGEVVLQRGKVKKQLRGGRSLSPSSDFRAIILAISRRLITRVPS